MALATQCPHCRTTFRVAQDQLKLRAGLVRCGHCKEIFNGIEHLLPPSAKPHTAAPSASSPPAFPAAPISAPPAVPPAVATVMAPAAPAQEPEADTAEVEKPATAMPHESPAVDEAPAIAPAAPPTELPDQAPPAREATRDKEETGTKQTEPRPDPLQRMTLGDFTQELPDDLEAYTDYPSEQLSHAEAKATDQPDELDEAIRDLQNKPWRGEKKAARKKKVAPLDDEDDIEEEEEDEPGFLKRGRRKQQLSRRLRIVFGLGSLILLIAALLQGAYTFRNQLAGSFPQTKPWLTQLCKVAGCRIDLPAQIASVSIESSELQTLASAKNRFVLSTLLRNYSTSAQEWPYIELTLNDANEKPLLRRVFKPAEYLTSRDEALSGFPATSERAIKINFALSQVQASGYRVYLFYP